MQFLRSEVVALRDEKKLLLEERKALRDTEHQLRRKEDQLRDMERLLLLAASATGASTLHRSPLAARCH